MFGFRRKEKEIQEVADKAMEVIELQRQTIREVAATNERLSHALDQAHADRVHFAEKANEALRTIVKMKTGVVSGAQRAVAILEERERQGDRLEEELLDAFKEILRAADKHDEDTE